MCSGNLIQVELDKWSSFFRNRERTSINLVVHLLLNLIYLHCILYRFFDFIDSLCMADWFNNLLSLKIVCFSRNREWTSISALTKEYCVWLIDSIIGFKQKVCDMIPGRKSFSNLYFYFDLISKPIHPQTMLLVWYPLPSQIKISN